MPAPAGNAPFSTAIIIDLTRSDDENSLGQQTLFSNNGLPRSESGGDMSDHAVESYAQKCIDNIGGSRIVNMGLRCSNSHALNSNVHCDSYISTGQPGGSYTRFEIQNRGLRDTDEAEIDVTVKRRKVAGRFTPSASTGNRLPEVQLSKPSFRAIAPQPAIITGEVCAEVAIARSTSSASSSIDRPFPEIQRNRVARQARVSVEGRVQKPMRSSEYLSKTLKAALSRYVFGHIRAALRPFYDDISKDIAAEIGREAALAAINHLGFGKHFRTNNFRLLPHYEAEVAERVRKYVNQSARDILGNRRVGQLLSSQKTNFPSVSTEETQSSTSESLGNENKSSHVLSSSESVEVFDEILEHHGHLDTGQHLLSQRAQSVSPSTSISNDNRDMQFNKFSQDYRHEDASLRRHPVRSTRASNPTYTLPKRQMKKLVQPPAHDHSRETPDKSPPCTEAALPRPYMKCSERKAFFENSKTTKSLPHETFSKVEIELLITLIKTLAETQGRIHDDPTEEITALMEGRSRLIQTITNTISYDKDGYSNISMLRGRSRLAIETFLRDVVNGNISDFNTFQTLSPPLPRSHSPPHRHVFDPLTTVLWNREIDGCYPARVGQGKSSFREIILLSSEDSLVPRSQWADCSSDIAAMSWTSEDAFIVGALTHSDPHNMQYNKAGNLLVGSVSKETLKSYPFHRIERPIIAQSQNLQNSSSSMRAMQSTWLYTSVVSTAHGTGSGYSFTSSYDHTVKVWEVSPDGSSMTLCGTWRHEDRVNFVVTSEHHDRVATASATNRDAVRVYTFCHNAISDSPYDEYGGNQSQEQAGDTCTRRPWSYQPATMKWARAPRVANLLLVGYSPRSETGDDSDIPCEKKNTGELCVWNVEDGFRYSVSSARLQNVFEVVWHPTQPVFAAATSPSGIYDSDRTKTQIRVFSLSDYTFMNIMALDCPARDINELTIMPNSIDTAWITASCTDGSTYVWDMAVGEDPLHVLRHGVSLDNPDPNLPLEVADGGVTFAAWGAHVGRFYTGATDGKLLAWDVRQGKGKTLVRTVLELSGGISSGAFSPDFKRLLIGDATGKVHLLKIDDSDLDTENAASEAITVKDFVGKSHDMPAMLPSNILRPKVIIPHEDPPPPRHIVSKMSIQEICHSYIEEGFLCIFPHYGVFQGPNYDQLGLYRIEAHENSDGTQPLLPEILAVQKFREVQRREEAQESSRSVLPRLPKTRRLDRKLHANNLKLNFDFSKLTLKTKQDLELDGVELDWEDSFDYKYEITPSRSIFRIPKKSGRVMDA